MRWAFKAPVCRVTERKARPVTDSSSSNSSSESLLHVCGREVLRPLRDQILRLSGYHVDSTTDATDALRRFQSGKYDLVLIDVEGECSIPDAEALCSEVKTQKPHQPVAFVCNWRVAPLSDCPDDIVRTEFDPKAFVQGVESVLAKH
jgi:DNA-binding response OmpR family regulator